MILTTIAKRCARLSLLYGTLLFLAANLLGFYPIFIVGIFYTLTAVIINSIILIILLLHLVNASPHHRLEIIKSAILLLFNVPVAIFYAWLLLNVQPNLL